MSLLIIADDLSGAADCAIGFASAGLRTVVTLHASSSFSTDDVIAADTDTRRLTPEAAAQRTRDAWSTLRAPGRRLYKKIDSTLRGNWAAEVAALQPTAGLAIVAPAFPATGRTVLGGRVFVKGAPLDSTDTWQLENAGREADLHRMLGAYGLRTASLELTALRGAPAALADRIETAAASGVQALIVDAETTEDLLALAKVTLHSKTPLFWVGSGGLARELATLPSVFEVGGAADNGKGAGGFAAGIDSAGADSNHSNDGANRAAADVPVAPTLILVGSVSAVSERQCAMLRERTDVNELIVPPAVLRRGDVHPDWSGWHARIGAVLAARTDLLLRIGRDQDFDPSEGAHLSSALAAMVAPHFPDVGGLIVTGGETARAMLSAVGIGHLQLITEIEAGVAYAQPIDKGTSPSMAHCPGIVTKAGAFGTEHALYAAWSHLRERSKAKPNEAKDPRS